MVKEVAKGWGGQRTHVQVQGDGAERGGGGEGWMWQMRQGEEDPGEGVRGGGKDRKSEQGTAPLDEQGQGAKMAG